MTSHRDDRRTRRRARWRLAAAALGALLFAGATAAPARADSNFQRGFEDQLGRILAYEAVSVGKHVLFQGVAHAPQPVHYVPHVGYGPPAAFYRPVRHPGRAPKHNHWRDHDHDRDYYRDRDRDRDRHHRHGRNDRHDRHHRHDRHCRH